MTSDYIVQVTDIYGGVLEEIPTKNLQYTNALNDSGSISFSLPIYHPKCNPDLMNVGARNLLVYRNDDLVWGGRLWTASNDAETAEIQFAGNGFFSLLLKRVVKDSQAFKNRDQLDLAWQLVNLAQSYGALGITRASTVGSGVLRDRTYPAFERKNIGEALQELSALGNGFDFDLGADLKWRTWYPSRGTTPDLVFELGKNIRGYSVQYDATNIENEITGIGSGDGAATKLSVKSNAASITTYGLMEGVRSWKDVQKQPTLDDHTQEELRVSKDPLVQPEFSLVTDDPPWGSYSLGDNVRVRIDDGYNQIDGGFRITTMTIAVADSGFESIGLFFNSQIG